MRIVLNASDTDDALDHILDLLIIVRREHAELRSRFLTDRDGYPTRSPGNGGSPSSDVDEDGTPLPPRSDSVANLVVSRDEASDPIGTALAILVHDIWTANKTLQHGIATAANCRPPVTIPDRDEIWCESCIRANVHEPREEGRKLCSWCRHEQTDHGKLPSRRLIQAHARGTRLTDKVRSEIAMRDAEDRRRNKAAKKTAA